MRKAALVPLLAILFPAAAAPQEDREPPVAVGARVGWASPVGSSYADPVSGDSYLLSDAFRSQLPVQLEAAWVQPRFAAGAYLSYGFDSVGSAVRATCAAVPATCTARTFRLGVQGFVRLGEPRPVLTTWAGLGAGWEWTSYDQSGGFAESFRGPEIVFQAGGDHRSGRHVSFGPYIQASVGRYLRIQQTAPAPFGSSRVPMDARFHGWIGFGLRVTVHP